MAKASGSGASGARGGSSPQPASTGAVGVKPIQLNKSSLPALTGTRDDIYVANKIRNSAVFQVNDYFATAAKRIDPAKKADFYARSKAMATSLFTRTSASWWRKNEMPRGLDNKGNAWLKAGMDGGRG